MRFLLKNLRSFPFQVQFNVSDEHSVIWWERGGLEHLELDYLEAVEE